MFVIGALPALVLVPLLWRYLPESTAFLQAKQARDQPGGGRSGRAAGQGQRQVGRAAVQARAGPLHHRLLGHLVHGAAAGLRPEHLAAADHAGRGLRARRGPRPAAGAQRRGRARPAVRRSGGRPDRQPPVHHHLVRHGRGLPGAAQHQDPRHRHLPRRVVDRDLRVQRAGPGLRLRRPGLSRPPPAARRWARPPASVGWAPSPVR